MPRIISALSNFAFRSRPAGGCGATIYSCVKRPSPCARNPAESRGIRHKIDSFDGDPDGGDIVIDIELLDLDADPSDARIGQAGLCDPLRQRLDQPDMAGVDDAA